MVKKNLIIEGNSKKSISDVELKKRVTKALKGKKITPVIPTGTKGIPSAVPPAIRLTAQLICADTH